MYIKMVNTPGEAESEFSLWYVIYNLFCAVLGLYNLKVEILFSANDAMKSMFWHQIHKLNP